MMTGGISDKLGNNYEAFWTVQRLVDVALGFHANSIHLEPLNVEGFEFSQSMDDWSEWHQVKTRSAGGQWTITALTEVLINFYQKLKEDNDARCVFVSDCMSQTFSLLCNQAHMAQTFDEFGRMPRARAVQNDLHALQTIWKGTDQETFNFLKRCSVRNIDKEELYLNLENSIASIVLTPPKAVIDFLTGYIIQNLTRRLNTSEIRQAMIENGIRFKPFVLGETQAEKIATITRSYLDDVRSHEPEFLIPRESILREFSDWLNNDQENILILSGEAGSGKSNSLASMVRKMIASDHMVLAFRMDNELDATSVDDLGRSLFGIDGNPTDILAVSAIDQTPVLVIDQLDAVSDASGRRPKTKAAAIDLIEARSKVGNVKAIIACRQYDIDNDERFKNIVSSDTSKSINITRFNWVEDIEPVLAGAGFNSGSLSGPQKEILCLPTHLSTFLKLRHKDEGNRIHFSTGNELIEALVHQTQRDLKSGGLSWSVWSSLTAIAKHMNTNQSLTAPISVLDEYPEAMNQLGSAGLIVKQNQSVRFGHESYFDFIFARSFTADQQDVGEWLWAKEQHLFRRTQIRQIMDYLRKVGRDEKFYRHSLNQIFLDGRTRFLVKDSVARWLATVTDPMDFELEIILGTCVDGRPNLLARTVFYGANWFPILMNNGVLREWIGSDDDEKINAAQTLVMGAFKNHQKIATDILEEFWSLDEEKNTLRTLRVLDFGADGEDAYPGFELYLKVIKKLPVEIISNNNRERVDLGMWPKKHSKLAAKLIAARMSRWLELEPDFNPFIGDGYQTGKTTRGTQTVAKESPVEFLESVGPIFIEALKRLDNTAEFKTDRAWTKQFGKTERWGGLLISTFPYVAQKAPKVLFDFLAAFPRPMSRYALILTLKGIACNGELGQEVFLEAMEHPSFFKSDYESPQWAPASEAIFAVKPYLSKEDWFRLEALIFNHKPEHAYAKKLLSDLKEYGEGTYLKREWIFDIYRKNGLAQLQLIDSLDDRFFSPSSQRSIDELRLKFKGENTKPEPSRMAGYVVSPIPFENAKCMSQEAWLSAIKKYDQDDRFNRRDPLIGGARELSHVLHSCVKESPEKFISLLEAISTNIADSYPVAILNGVRESDTDHQHVLRTLEASTKFFGESIDRAFIDILSNFPKVAETDWIFDKLVVLATSGEDPFRSSQTNEDDVLGQLDVESLFERGGRIIVNGHSGRKLAYEALSKVAWNLEERSEELFTVLENNLSKETNLDVLPGMICVAHGLINYDRSRAFSLLNNILLRDIRLVATYDTMHIYQWMFWQNDAGFASLFNEFLNCDVEAVQAIGFLWSAAKGLSEPDYENDWQDICNDNLLALRCSAKVANDLLKDSPYRAKALAWLLERADDKKIESEALFECDWSYILEEGGELLQLVEKFIESSQFEHSADRLVIWLDDRAEQYPSLSIKAAERILKIHAGQGDDTTHDRHLSLHNLGKLIVGGAEAFAGDEAKLHQVLNLVDSFLEANIYDTDRALRQYDRL